MNLEYLRHGKTLCGKVFRRFVETFNFHNDFISNLKGDADMQVVGGKVKVDRTDERHPVIRCQGCGGGSKSEETPPDDVSVEHKEIVVEPPQHEGEDPVYGLRLQIKGFDAGTPTSSEDFADYLSREGTPYPGLIPVRIVENGMPKLVFVPFGLGLRKEKYTKGDDTNITFTPVATGSNVYKIDVYYS